MNNIYNTLANNEIDIGNLININRYCPSCDTYRIDDFIDFSSEKLDQMLEESEQKETDIFNKIQNLASEWEKLACHTRTIRSAIQFNKTPDVQHTSNEFVDEENDWHTISNRTYKLTYRIYNNGYKPSNPWDLTILLSLNHPVNPSEKVQIESYSASLPTLKAAETRLGNKLKKYRSYFSSESPAVPKEYIRYYSVQGHLLPGYALSS